VHTVVLVLQKYYTIKTTNSCMFRALLVHHQGAQNCTKLLYKMLCSLMMCCMTVLL